MIPYLLRRSGASVLVLFGITLLTFVVFFALSPDPAVTICGKTCTPDRIETIRGVLGLDQPFLTQYGHFLQGLFVGRRYGVGENAVQCAAPCLGFSFQTNQPVLQMIAARLPQTVTVAVGAAVLWLLVGVSGGLLGAIKRGTVWDKGAMLTALGGISLPNYFLALLLQYVLVVRLQVLPFPDSSIGLTQDPVGWFESYLMPWIVLAFGYASLYLRLTRDTVLDTLSENYVRTGRAKGLPRGLLLRRYALRPSMAPVVTLFGMDFAGLLAGALIAETVFGINGVGKLAADSIATNDQPVIMAVTLLAALLVVVGNMVVDVVYTLLDPRVRISQ